MSQQTLRRWLIAVLTIATAAVALVTYVRIRHDRAALAEQFSQERLQTLTQAVGQVETDLADVIEDLQFVARLLAAMPAEEDRQRTLRTLLATVRPYHATSLYELDGERTLTLTDPRSKDGLNAAAEELLHRAAIKAMDLELGAIDVSLPIIEGQRWLRAFALRIPSPAHEPPRAIALLVDTAPLLAELRFIAADPNTHLLVLGPHGRPAPSSSPLAAELARDPPRNSEFAAILRRLERGESGTTRIEEREARALGFESGDLIAAYAPLRIDGGRPWAVATLTSMAQLRTHERSIIVRLSLAAAVVSLGLVSLGIYVVGTNRQKALLRERLRHAGEVAHLHEKARTVLESIPTGVLVLDEGGRITDMNRALRARWPQRTGARLEEALAEAPDAVGPILELVATARREGAQQTQLAQAWPLFGEPGHFALHAVPLRPSSPSAAVLLVIEDFTELRALESQLLRAEKLTTVGVLAAGIAHEIGTPLGVVRGRAEYVATKLGPAHPQASSLHVIVEQIERIVRTIRELLDFSRAKSVAMLAVDLEQVTRKSTELLRYEIERRRVEVSTEVSGPLPPLSADADQLQQVLVNLLINALDACAPGGRVELRARQRPATRSSGESVRIEICDTGCGIPTADLHRVFDPFFTTKKRGQGTGLGLSIVAQIVRSHGARIELDSHPGEGTRVILDWPAAARGEHADAA